MSHRLPGKELYSAVMTDDKRSHAMMRFHYGFFDGALEPWTDVIVDWTPDCRDTGELVYVDPACMGEMMKSLLSKYSEPEHRFLAANVLQRRLTRYCR